MTRPKASQRFGANPRTALAFAILAICAVATAGTEKPSDTHMLNGVVYAKDGKPAAGVTVAMAQVRHAFIFIDNEAEISVWGPTKKRFFFLSRRNGKTACETTTDEQGRFTLKGFISTSVKYSIVAGSKDTGLAILENVRPKDHVSKPLRIEIEEPAYLTLPRMPKPPGDELSAYTTVRLAPDKARAAAEKGDDEPRRNVMMSLYVDTTSDVDVVRDSEGPLAETRQLDAKDLGKKTYRAGPLVGGKRYSVSHFAWGKRLGYSATLFETKVLAESGKTIPVRFPDEGGVALSGRIVTKEGSPLADVNVMLRVGNPGFTLGAVTDKDGAYTIRHAPSGEYKLELLRHAIRTGPG